MNGGISVMPLIKFTANATTLDYFDSSIAKQVSILEGSDTIFLLIIRKSMTGSIHVLSTENHSV